MQRNNGARLFPIFIVIIIIVVVIIGVVSIGRALFNSGDSTDTSESDQDNGRTQLLDTSDGHSVRLTVRGPIVAEEEFNSYDIDVSPSDRTMNVYKGYRDDIQKSKNLSNNDSAYEQFVYALDKANMMKGKVPADDDQNDLRGICATGYVYEYSVLVNDESVKRLWTSTCSGSKGSLDASVSQLNDLFQKQIPNSDDLIPFNQSPLRFSL